MIRALGLPEAAPISQPATTPAPTASSFFAELARAFLQKAQSEPAANTLAPTGTEAALSPTSTYAPAIAAPAPMPSGSLHNLIVAAAHQEGIPPALLAAVAQVESGFQANAVSRVGAKGLTQLMDGTARALGVTNSFDPWQNLVGGARYLHSLLNRYSGNLTLALAAYNAGPGAVDAAGRQVPPFAETQAYVRRVSAAYDQQSRTFPTDGRIP